MRRVARILPLLLWAVPLSATIAATPTIVRSLGPEAYGAYTIALSVAAFAIMPPPGAAVARFRVAGMDGTALDALGRQVGAILLVASLINIAVIGLPTVLMPLRPFLPTLSMQAFVVASAGLMILSNVLSQLLVALLQASGQWSRGAVVMLLASLSVPIAASVLAMAGANWPTILFGQASVSLCGFIALTIVHGGGPASATGSERAAPASAIAKFMIGTAVSSALGSIMAIAERWLLGGKFGIPNAGYFALAMSLALLIHAFVLALNVQLPGMLAASRERASQGGIVAIYERTVRISALAACLAFALIVARGETFIQAWLGEQVGAQVHPYLVGLSISNFAMAMIIPTWILAETTGNERANILFMLALIAGWAAMIALAMAPLGAQSVVAGRLFAIVAVPVAIVLIERRSLGRFRIQLWGPLLLRLALAFGAAVAASLLVPNKGLVGLLIGSAVTVLTYGIVTWFSGLWRMEDLHASRS